MSSSRSQVYTNAGVNIEAGNDLVSQIKSIVATTHTKGVMCNIGSFGGLFRPEIAGMTDPIFVCRGQNRYFSLIIMHAANLMWLKQKM